MNRLSVGQRFCIILRQLVIRDARVTRAASYRMSPAIVGSIVKENYPATWSLLCGKEYVSPPLSEEAWRVGFQERRNFLAQLTKSTLLCKLHQVLLSILTTKKKFSVLLMAACDTKYKLTLVDIGDTGR